MTATRLLQPAELLGQNSLSVRERFGRGFSGRTAEPLEIVKIEQANPGYLASRRLHVARNGQVHDQKLAPVTTGYRALEFRRRHDRPG